MSKTLWHFLIEGKHNSKQGVVANFYAYGDHLGAAMQSTFELAPESDIFNPYVAEAELLENSPEELPEDAIPLSDNVYMLPKVFTYPLEDDTQYDFIAPTGIVKSIEDGELAYEKIKTGYAIHEENDSSFRALEVNAEKGHLANIFFDLIKLVPDPLSFQLYIHDHWENNKEELWENDSLTRSEKIATFLRQHQPDTVENGHVGIIIGSTEQEARLVLTDHKKILFTMTDGNLMQAAVSVLKKTGYNEANELYNFEAGYYHWHYHPYNSLPKNDFITMLQQNGFKLIESFEGNN